MLNTKNLITNEKDIPSYWVFRYYLKLNEELTGQDVKIKSVWNPSERTPSFCLYVDKSKMCYMYKDFSTGKGGDKVTLVCDIFNISYGAAVEKIINDYNAYTKTNGTTKISFKVESKWQIGTISNREWNQNDANYWLQYNIGSSMLNRYNVRPIESYNMNKDNESIKIEAKYLYGYYTKNGDIYKIYQPYNRKHKFHKVDSYVQGLDQLEYNNPYLVICSSLKDAMCLKSFGYNIEVIAPDSENSLIKPHVIENLKIKYKKVITLFDNDEAGKKAIDKYKSVYDLDGLCLDKDKDISDSVQNHGVHYVHSILSPLLKKTIHK